VVLTGVTVGRGSVVAASIMTRDIQPYSIAAGVPEKGIGQRFADKARLLNKRLLFVMGNFNFLSAAVISV
jgi:acetyltransferase-like isoleucine patch superfamily enzyme